MKRGNSGNSEQKKGVPKFLNARWRSFENRAVKNFTPFQLRLWEIVVFLSRFLLLAIPFHMILWTGFDAEPLQQLTASSVGAMLSLCGVEASVDGSLIDIIGAGWGIEIIKDCVGWKSYLALAGLMFAVRGVALRKRLVGTIAALPVIYIGNTFRIFSSIYLGLIFGTEHFAFVHDILWQGGLIALVLCSWLVWLNEYARPDISKI